MEKETCLNCAHKRTCIRRSTTIYQLFIVTGRQADAQNARENMDIRPGCESWARSEKQS